MGAVLLFCFSGDPPPKKKGVSRLASCSIHRRNGTLKKDTHVSRVQTQSADGMWPHKAPDQNSLVSLCFAHQPTPNIRYQLQKDGGSPWFFLPDVGAESFEHSGNFEAEAEKRTSPQKNKQTTKPPIHTTNSGEPNQTTNWREVHRQRWIPGWRRCPITSRRSTMSSWRGSSTITSR